MIILQMFTKAALTRIRAVASIDSRNFGIMVPAMQKASDPIQQLFLDKLREYKSKSKYVFTLPNGYNAYIKIIFITIVCLIFGRNDSFVDPTPQIQEELKAELERVARVCSLN